MLNALFRKKALISSKDPRDRSAIGHEAESLACAWLERRGIELVERNYRCRWGEIDIIGHESMRGQPDTLVFVEVRYRGAPGMVPSEETIGARKIQRLMATIDHYLQHRGIDPRQPWRLDALGMEGSLRSPRYRWVKDLSA